MAALVTWMLPRVCHWSSSWSAGYVFGAVGDADHGGGFLAGAAAVGEADAARGGVSEVGEVAEPLLRQTLCERGGWW